MGWDGHDWTPIFVIGGVLYAAAIVWLGLKGGFRTSVSEVVQGLLWLAVICLFGGLVVWGVIDAWLLGGGIPYEESYRR